LWAPDGSAISYRSSSHVVKVPVNTENGFRLGNPERLFEDRYMLISSTPPGRWDIHPDGDQFPFVKPTINQISNATELVVIENWLETLRNPDRVGELR
jgi:hypothetical protein